MNETVLNVLFLHELSDIFDCFHCNKGFFEFLIKIDKILSDIVENLKKKSLIILALKGCCWIFVKKRVWMPNTMPTGRKVA